VKHLYSACVMKPFIILEIYLAKEQINRQMFPLTTKFLGRNLCSSHRVKRCLPGKVTSESCFNYEIRIRILGDLRLTDLRSSSLRKPKD
jgi:hypothetical protein